MPAKGEKYNEIGIDLAAWCEDHMTKHRFTQADMARRLNVNRGRVSQMLQGKINTVKYVRLAAINCEGGNYMALAKYADADALRKLQDWQFEQSLDKKTGEEYQRILDAVQGLVRKGSAKDLLKMLKSLEGMTK